MEMEAAKHSGQVIFAEKAGVVTEMSGNIDEKGNTKYRIVITHDDGDDEKL